jgi:hypothetical protein
MSGRKYKIPTAKLIEDSLYWKIRGYDYDEVTSELREVECIDPQTQARVLKAKMVETKVVVKQVQPDTQAIIFAAKKLIPEKYADNEDGGSREVVFVDPDPDI